MLLLVDVTNNTAQLFRNKPIKTFYFLASNCDCFFFLSVCFAIFLVSKTVEISPRTSTAHNPSHSRTRDHCQDFTAWHDAAKHCTTGPSFPFGWYSLVLLRCSLPRRSACSCGSQFLLKKLLYLFLKKRLALGVLMTLLPALLVLLNKQSLLPPNSVKVVEKCK